MFCNILSKLEKRASLLGWNAASLKNFCFIIIIRVGRFNFIYVRHHFQRTEQAPNNSVCCCVIRFGEGQDKEIIYPDNKKLLFSTPVSHKATIQLASLADVLRAS